MKAVEWVEGVEEQVLGGVYATELVDWAGAPKHSFQWWYWHRN